MAVLAVKNKLVAEKYPKFPGYLLKYRLVRELNAGDKIMS